MLPKGKTTLTVLLCIFLTALLACSPQDGDDPDRLPDDNGDQDEEAKVVILATSTHVDFGRGEGEEHTIAEQMKAEFGDRVIVTSPHESWQSSYTDTTVMLLEIVEDPSVKAIIVTPGIVGVNHYISAVRAVHPDIFFFVASPMYNPDDVAASDIVIHPDEVARGPKLVEQAHKMGAGTFVHYSFDRHMSVDIIEERLKLMKQTAEELGLDFVEVVTADPVDITVDGLQAFIIEDVPQKIAEYGPDTAFFGTSEAMMEPMLTQVIINGGIFPGLNDSGYFSPTYHILADVFGVDVPESQKADLPWILDQVNDKATEMGMAGRIATSPVSPNLMSIQAGTYYAMDWLDGKIEDRNDKEALQAIMTDVAGAPLQMQDYPGTDNCYLYLFDSVILSE
ncbi:MAG: DUF3798 domain-containing protein [Firmicutes bacterium]|nr:DUF3798 domain-containing protein [Bacillota bacterium]